MRIVMGIFGGDAALDAKLKDPDRPLTKGDIRKHAFDQYQTNLLLGAGLAGLGAYGLHKSRKATDPNKKRKAKRLGAMGLGLGLANLAYGGVKAGDVSGANKKLIGVHDQYREAAKEDPSLRGKLRVKHREV